MDSDPKLETYRLEAKLNVKDGMDQFAYEVLKAFALTHNYNNWIYQTFRPYISKNVLEIGCGIGNMSRYLLKSCDKLIGIDISSQFL